MRSAVLLLEAEYHAECHSYMYLGLFVANQTNLVLWITSKLKKISKNKNYPYNLGINTEEANSLHICSYVSWRVLNPKP